jgi:FkbM family methyltransferase
MHLIEKVRADVAIDVGANIGQYGRALRGSGFTGRMVSIEPQPLAFSQLESIAARDPLWHCKQVALAETEGEAILHIAKNSVSSSLLPMTDYMASAFTEAAEVAKASVRQTTVESILKEFGLEQSRVFLKIDAQGYEEHVLAGARSVISQIKLIETELPLRPMYQGGSSFSGVSNYLSQLNYWLVSLEANTWDPRTEHIVEVNAMFARED